MRGSVTSTLSLPTGTESRRVVRSCGPWDVVFDELEKGEGIPVTFDGADEIDDEFNLIKGGGDVFISGETCCDACEDVFRPVFLCFFGFWSEEEEKKEEKTLKTLGNYN